IGNREQGNSRQERDVAYLLKVIGTAWLLEPDDAMLERLALLPGLEDVCAAMTPEAAALEYSQVILQLVPPYASLLLDEEAMLNSAQAERVEAEYRLAGFSILPEWRAGPADHLGVELQFLGHLLAVDEDRAARFLNEYLLPWAPVCLLAISRIERATLYPALADVTLQVLTAIAPDDS
ncbi:MAG: molecular chaperone TorD family protein, partial [Thermomicrobiales bacterium]